MSFLEGAVNPTISNSTINNTSGDATIFNFYGDGPLHEDMKALFVDRLAGSVATTDRCPKLEKHILSQSVRNLPRTNAAYNDYESKDRKRVTCFENTRQTLREEIGEWITATILDNPEIYALSGLAGIGKSTVAQTVAEWADNHHLLGASFFFSRDESDRRNARKFYSTIAFQLCLYDKQFAQAIGNALLEEKGAAAMSKEPMEQLDALIVEPLRGLLNQRSRPLVVVVDALDECDEEDGLIVLETLEHLVHELPSLRVVLTSRPRPLLDGYFENHRIFRMHDIEDKVVDDDIRRYLKYRLSCEQVKSHLKLRYPWSADEEEIELLVRAAGRLFIIASTAVLFILDKTARDPASRMKTLQTALSQDLTPFNTLNEFYTIILRSAVPTNCDRDIIERYQAVIGTIAVVQDPLPIATLSNLIGLNSATVYGVLDNLQSVILLGDNDIPRVYHKSFLDYIRDTARCKDDNLRIIPTAQHARITVYCFDIMNMCLKRNILDIGTPAQYMDNSDGLEAEGISYHDVCEKISPELQYACTFWANHFESADTENINLTNKVDAFARERLLYWLEALSWICKLDLAPRALLAVHDLLKSSTREILFDAFRFISKNYDVIQRSALHVYHSALPFTPKKIPLHNIYKKDNNLRHLRGGPELWDALIAIAKHEGSVYRIAFSQDGSLLASCGGQEMMLRDATSGTPVKNFDGDKIALARDFSVVVLSHDSALMMYYVTSDTHIATYVPPAKVVELALSFDGSRLAAGLSDGTVILWDRGIAEPIARLDGYARSNGRLEFSPAGYRLAFMSNAGGIRLCNGFTGGSIANLDYKPEKHAKFVLSWSGSRLAVWTNEGDHVYYLTLWNSEDWKFVDVAMNVGEWLAVSDDGSLIVTGRTTEVQLWSGNSLTLVDTLDITFLEIWIIRCLALSHDTLAIGSNQGVTLYDVKTHAVITSVNFSDPLSLVLSPTRLAISNDNGEIHLWDIHSKNPYISTSRKQATALAFSSDCSRLASGFWDGTIELRDTGHPEQVIATRIHHRAITALPAPTQGIMALAFSVDGEQLASGSRRSVSLWGGRDLASDVRVLTSDDRVLIRRTFSSFTSDDRVLIRRTFTSDDRDHSRHTYRDLTSLALSSDLLAVAEQSKITLFDSKALHLVHSLEEGSLHLSFSSDGSLLAYTHFSAPVDGFGVKLLDVETRAQIARFKSNTSDIQRLVFSPDHSQLAALTPYGLEFFDIINKCTINPQREEINRIFQNGIFISQPAMASERSYRGYGQPLLGHFPGHPGGVPILWVPMYVGIRVFTAESSMFALECTDGRLMIGHIPPAPATP